MLAKVSTVTCNIFTWRDFVANWYFVWPTRITTRSPGDQKRLAVSAQRTTVQICIHATKITLAINIILGYCILKLFCPYEKNILPWLLHVSAPISMNIITTSVLNDHHLQLFITRNSSNIKNACFKQVTFQSWLMSNSAKLSRYCSRCG